MQHWLWVLAPTGSGRFLTPMAGFSGVDGATLAGGAAWRSGGGGGGWASDFWDKIASEDVAVEEEEVLDLIRVGIRR